MESSEYAAMRAVEDDHWWYRGLRALALDRLGDSQRILDVGCGTGGMLDRFRDRQAVGVDCSRVALELSRERGLRGLCAASACALPFRSESFDAVLALDVIYHRAVADEGAALRECGRVLRPGGIFLLQVPAYRRLAGRHDLRVHGARRYTAEAVRRLVLAAGFEIVELTYRNLAALPFAFIRRCLVEKAGSRVDRGGASELRPLPAPLNALLALAMRVENAFLDLGSLPAGLSVWCQAKRPG
ncbi:MAG TPA: class I SAM-dependent methyltransferase [Candidatus Deferrimicrobiaceae bacterium]|jgi:SAM-dependent methyltransferase